MFQCLSSAKHLRSFLCPLCSESETEILHGSQREIWFCTVTPAWKYKIKVEIQALKKKKVECVVVIILSIECLSHAPSGGPHGTLLSRKSERQSMGKGKLFFDPV